MAENISSSDLTVVLSWDTSDNDVDLSIIGPNNEEAYFSSKSFDFNGIDD